ncbi:hypothetical protein RhiirA4_546769 [Rhizophagus irregularis]|uniref:Uncharacterized protein n=1 Tax=Rhizophagus irregularis TaxID=588596 RepID=A0A2I1GYW4_9GLOM|nr:hypothetical protein RhiirA4_546769 [Rhizophagus irregularis]
MESSVPLVISTEYSPTSKTLSKQEFPFYNSYPSPNFNYTINSWDFGTLQLNSQLPTVCNTAGNANYVVTIPASDVFWDPPIVAGDPNLAGYTVTLPGTVTAINFDIDLYRLQQIGLKNNYR